MKDHEVVRTGIATTYWREGANSGYDSYAVARDYTSLSNVYSTTGDRKSPNPHRYSVSQWKDFEGTDSLRVGSNYEVVATGVIGTGSSDLHFAQPLMDETLTLNNALADLYGQLRGNLDLSIDLAEARSTKAMLSAQQQLRGFAGRLDRAKIVGGLWLQAQYGWLPLASSIYGSCDEIFRQQVNNWARLRARRSVQEAFTKRARQSDGTVNTHTILNTAKVEFKIDYLLGGFNLQNWTSLNPVSIAWELMPYSFVVDWVYNVGDYVRSMETALLSGKSFRGGYVTIVRGQQVHVNRFFFGRRPRNPANYISSLTADGSGRRIEYSRTILSAPPIPRAPVVSVDLGVRHLLNGAALLAQLLPDRTRGPRQRGSYTT